MAMDLESGRILVFKNDKAGNEKRPDYRGECKTPEGNQYRFSLWLDESKAGEKYMQGQIEAIEAPTNTASAPSDSGSTSTTEAREAATQAQTQTDDDIPF